MSDLRDLPETLGEVTRRFFAYTSPWMLAALAVGSVGVRALLGAPTAWDAIVAFGVVAWWPLNEWLIHVLILHYRPKTLLGVTLDFRVPQLHREHHADPWQLDLVLIPLRVYLLIPVVGIALALSGGAASAPAWTGVAVYLLLSLHYEWVHFLVHTRYRPRSAFYRRLWRNHRLHHFKNEHYWFGFTMLTGDRLLGTAPDYQGAATSPTARSLASQPGSEF